MLLIPCPHCGPRAEIEFRYGGESHIQRPGPLNPHWRGEVSDEAWADYLFFRDNPKGAHRERWLHSAGCRRWFNLVRDTVSHRILAAYPMGASAPDGIGAPEAAR